MSAFDPKQTLPLEFTLSKKLEKSRAMVVPR
jgi:hypothetical protein